MSVEASYTSDKLELLARANREIEVLRWLVRLAEDRTYGLDPFSGVRPVCENQMNEYELARWRLATLWDEGTPNSSIKPD
jgi:hypothetical protein